MLTSTSRGLRTVRTGYACQPPAYCTYQRRKALYAYQPRACVPYVPTLAPQALPRSCAPAYDVRAAIDVLGRGTYSQLRVGLELGLGC